MGKEKQRNREMSEIEQGNKIKKYETKNDRKEMECEIQINRQTHIQTDRQTEGIGIDRQKIDNAFWLSR